MTRGARIAIVLVLALAACKPASAPPITPVAAAPSLDQLHHLYMTGRHGEAVLMATAIVQGNPDDREIVAHARLFRAMSWLEQDRRVEQARALLELRELELQYGDHVWGQLAAAYVDKILRADLLQEALLELTLELRELEQEIRGLELILAQTQAELATRDAKMSSVEQERDHLREQINAAKVKAKLDAGRILELEAELAALKQVDMQREP
jgi:hypothetical protein